MRISNTTMAIATAAFIASSTLALAQGTRSGEGTVGSTTESSIVNGNRTLSGKSSNGQNTMGSAGSGSPASATAGSGGAQPATATDHN